MKVSSNPSAVDSVATHLYELLIGKQNFCRICTNYCKLRDANMPVVPRVHWGVHQDHEIPARKNGVDHAVQPYNRKLWGPDKMRYRV